ncbi:MAG: hypothetical protein KF699_08080 [Phycisphaeraceae bacterium]|nr:hypothetical protein [Phycisphaeraceae bacterium]
MNTRTLMLAAMVGVLASASVAAPVSAPVQPEPRGEHGARPAPQGSRDAAVGRRMLRELIERRLEFSRRQQERMERALRMLEEGADPADVEAEFPDIGRGPSGPAGAGGPPGGMMDGDMGDGPPGPRGPGRGQREPGGSGSGGREPPLDRPLTDEERAAVREFLRTAQPRLHEMFAELEAADPDEAARRLREMFPRIRPMIELRQNDPALYELRMRELRTGREAMEAARRFIEVERTASSPEAERTRAEAALRAAVGAHLDARAEIGRHELARQIERAQRDLAEIEGRSADRDADVQRMMTRMIERERQRARDGDKPHGDEAREGQRGRPGRRGDQRP